MIHLQIEFENRTSNLKSWRTIFLRVGQLQVFSKPIPSPPSYWRKSMQSLCKLKTTLLIGMIVQLAFSATTLAQEPAAEVKLLKVAVLVFPGVELLDFAGPSEVFGGSSDSAGNPLFEVYTVGLSKQPIESLGFVSINPKYDPTDAPLPDVLLIPGGNVMPVMDDVAMMKWIEQRAKEKCLMFSVCNGASVLAKLGVLDGLKVATHHGNTDILKLLAPKATVLTDKRFVDNGQVVTTAGVSAGIDGALYLVARLRGFEAARRVATGIEFDYWAGFKSQADAIPKPDADGLIAQAGLVHEDSDSCSYMQLMKIFNREGFESALKKYPDLLASKHGEMVSEASLDETAGWLQKHSRDPEVAISAFRFIAAAHPQSFKAHLRLGEALLAFGRKKEAKWSIERALELNSNSESAKAALQTCRD
jgi:putative intracellular protease/amidase